MNLLLNRDQEEASLFSLVPLRIGSGVIFHLQAELELDEEETALMERYKFASAVLVSSDVIDDLKQAVRPAIVVALLVFFAALLAEELWRAASISLVVLMVMTVAYFRTMREQIVVRDLLNGGRTFRCDSIVALIHKEAFLENVCSSLRQVLESAKHWHDRETLPIKVLDKEAAKQLVLTLPHD